jgi:hypothetical protein
VSFNANFRFVNLLNLLLPDIDSPELSRETLNNFKDFLKSKLPEKIRNDTEADHHSLPDWLIKKLPEIISNCTDTVFAEFERTQLSCSFSRKNQTNVATKMVHDGHVGPSSAKQNEQQIRKSASGKSSDFVDMHGYAVSPSDLNRNAATILSTPPRNASADIPSITNGYV